MDDNKKFELGDEALDQVAGGFEVPFGYEYDGTDYCHCNICHQSREMKRYRNDGSGSGVMFCLACGQKYHYYL